MGLLRRIRKTEHRDNRGSKYYELTLKIDGSELPNGTATSAALASGLGKEWAVARDDGSNTVTVTFNEKLPGVPIIKCVHAITADGALDETTASITAAQVVYDSVKKTDGTALADMDCVITLLVPYEDN